MRARNIALIVLLAIFFVFTAANWSVISTPVPTSLLVTRVQAPIGLFLLGFTVLIIVAFALLIAVQQASVLVETRRTGKELAAQRALADQAEASRFTELRKYIEEELQRLDQLGGRRQGEVLERIDLLESALRIHIEETGNSMAASLGEVDDHVERLAATRDGTSADAPDTRAATRTAA